MWVAASSWWEWDGGPIVAVTPRSGRTLEAYRYAALNITQGWIMFQDEKKAPSRQGAFEGELFDTLPAIQSIRPDLIDSDEDVAEVYGISRSLRHTALLHMLPIRIFLSRTLNDSRFFGIFV
jgi:hypothetical protein